MNTQLIKTLAQIIKSLSEEERSQELMQACFPDSFLGGEND